MLSQDLAYVSPQYTIIDLKCFIHSLHRECFNSTNYYEWICVDRLKSYKFKFILKLWGIRIAYLMLFLLQS